MITVIGGANLDILGDPSAKAVLRDSNIGHVTFRAGGVGRNIAAAVTELGVGSALLTCIGDDRNGDRLYEECEELGIDMSLTQRVPEDTNVYLAMHDENGDMLCAINDMRCMDHLLPSLIQKNLDRLNQSSLVILDANLPVETLEAAAALITVPLMLDPVSCVKAPKCLSILDRLTAIKPNLREAEALTGKTDVRSCAEELLQKGVRQVYISMGKDGVYYASAYEKGRLIPSSVTRMLQTGAGDAMCAGIACGIQKGYPISHCAQAGIDAAWARITGSEYKFV